MMGNIEVIAFKNNKRIVNYYTVTIYNGITNDYYDRFKNLGYKDIQIRII